MWRFFLNTPYTEKIKWKTYFIDFYFPQLKLGIELDGTQHKNTFEYDTERDSYIEREYEIQILRVTHSEYKKKTKLKLIEDLLKAIWAGDRIWTCVRVAPTGLEDQRLTSRLHPLKLL